MHPDTFMKKIILIGGTSYSGSTLLDLMLSNDNTGFSCGELYALFIPSRVEHLRPQCICGDLSCDIWETVEKLGKTNCYEGLFSKFSDLKFIVDSSKDFIWIREQSNNLTHKKICFKNLLIWKTPAEFALSCLKRGKFNNWRNSWVNYHKRYLSVVDEFIPIRYSKLITETESTLESLCSRIDIPYFRGKEAYWQKKHHTLFGSISAKLHLYEKNAEAYNKLKDEIGRHQIKNHFTNSDSKEIHRTIYREDYSNHDIRLAVDKQIIEDYELRQILEILEAISDDSRSYSSLKDEIKKIGVSRTYVFITKYRKLLRSRILKRKHRIA